MPVITKKQNFLFFIGACILILIAGVCIFAASASSPASADEVVTRDFNTIPMKGNVTMIDLGAKKCIPCKMMAPIMEKLEKAYRGKADIVFIDVWKNRNQAERFGVRSIPTQIFFDQDGKEVFRHLGFLDEAPIIRQLSRMGVQAPESLIKAEASTKKGL